MIAASQRLAWWPVPRILFPAMFAVMALGSLGSSLRYLSAEYYLWALTNRIIHDSLWIPGSVLVGVTAAVAIMISPPQGIIDNQPAHLLRTKANLYQLLGIIVTACLGHFIGLAPLLFLTARYSNGGGLSWASVLVACSGIATLSSIGFFAGLGAHKMFVAPLVALACFLLSGIIYEPLFRPLALVFPVHHVIGSARFETNPAVAVFSLIVAVALILAGLIAFRSERDSFASRRIETSRHSLDNSRYFPALCVALLVVCGFVWRPELLTVKQPVKTNCSDVHGVRVCLHIENEPARHSINTALANLHQAGVGVFTNAISDDAAVDSDYPEEKEVFIRLDPGPYSSDQVVGNVEESVALQIVNHFTVDRCIGRSVQLDNQDANSAIASRILEIAGYENLASVLGSSQMNTVEALSQQEFIKFIRDNREAISTCSLNSLSQ